MVVVEEEEEERDGLEVLVPTPLLIVDGDGAAKLWGVILMARRLGL